MDPSPNPDPPRPNLPADMDTLRRFGPTPTKLSLEKSFVTYLVTNSICKLFVDKDKEKQLFRSNSAAFIIASRTVYARIKCEQQNFVVDYEQWIPDFSSLHGE